MYFELVAILFFVGSNAQQCRNEYGEPVDWYFLYKLPKLQQKDSLLLRKGVGYVYLTSKHPGADWRLGMKSVNDTDSIVGRTLAPLYDKSISGKLFSIAYNDDPPSQPTTLTYGHTKGVVLSDGRQGIWLVHSAPNFPIEPYTKRNVSETVVEKTWNRYTYPTQATKYGQSFLCVTLPAKDLNSVGNLLRFNRPKIYHSHVPEELKAAFPNLTLAASSDFVKAEPYHYKTQLTTVGGSKFVGYAKTRKFKKDLYTALVAPDLKDELEVETWRNGKGELPSECKTSYPVMNILSLNIRMERNLTYSFKNSQDHSKWAVSGKNKSTICIGDINRMEAQLKRGGGTLCFTHPQIWSRYKKAIAEKEGCTHVASELATKGFPKSKRMGVSISYLQRISGLSDFSVDSPGSKGFSYYFNSCTILGRRNMTVATLTSVFTTIYVFANSKKKNSHRKSNGMNDGFHSS